MRPTITSLLLLLATLYSSGDAHSHGHRRGTVREEEDVAACSCEPGVKAFESFHIHVVFYPDSIGGAFGKNTHNSNFARSLRRKFVDRFNVSECDEDDGGLFDQTELCAFSVDEETGSGGHAPFVAPNFAFFVPVDRYSDTVPWMMANRGDLDFVVHPNSCGFECSAQDHLLWSVWGGNKWQLRFQLPTNAEEQHDHARRNNNEIEEDEDENKRARRRQLVRRAD